MKKNEDGIEVFAWVLAILIASLVLTLIADFFIR
jgi:hypothetical protein